MRELIKTDLKRMIKDKLFLIAILIGLGFAVTSPLLYKIMLVFLFFVCAEGAPSPPFAL